MNAIYWQKGDTLDYTPTEDVENGQVVSLGTRVGVAGTAIPANQPGHLHVVGVFEMEKAAEEIALGAALYYDVSAKKITATIAENVPAGYAVAAAKSTDATVLIKLLG